MKLKNQMAVRQLSSNVARNIRVLIVENLLRLVLGVFISVYIARILGPQDFGIFSYILSFVFIFAPFYLMGVDEYTVREILESNLPNGEIVASSMLVRLIGGVVGTLLSFCVIYVLRHESMDIVFFTCLYSMFMNFKCFDSINNHFQALVDIRKVSWLRNMAFLAASLLKVIGILYFKSWKFFVIVSCVELALVGIGYYAIFRVSYPSIRLKLNMDVAKKLFVNSMPVFYTLLLVSITSKVDQLMIAGLVGDAELGQYAVAVKLVEVWQFLPLAIVSTLYPGIVSARVHDQDRKILQLYSTVFWLSLVFAIAVTLMANWVVEMLYGVQYAGAGSLLSLYVWLSIFVFFSMARIKVLTLKNALYQNLYLTLIVLAINIILNMVFIPVYYAWGAILASILAYILGNLFGVLIWPSIRDSWLVLFKSIAYPLSWLRI